MLTLSVLFVRAVAVYVRKKPMALLGHHRPKVGIPKEEEEETPRTHNTAKMLRCNSNF
jgi:hypothetical protein